MIKIYTDGSGTTAEKAGGWAYIVVENNQEILRGSGGQAKATNNQMELMAAIQGLIAYGKIRLSENKAVLISDSEYTVMLASGIYNAKKNKELARILRIGIIVLDVEAQWIKAHNGDKWNELVDDLAGKERKRYFVL